MFAGPIISCNVALPLAAERAKTQLSLGAEKKRTKKRLPGEIVGRRDRVSSFFACFFAFATARP